MISAARLCDYVFTIVLFFPSLRYILMRTCQDQRVMYGLVVLCTSYIYTFCAKPRSECVFFRYTRGVTVPSSFRIINVSRKGRMLTLSSSYVNFMLVCDFIIMLLCTNYFIFTCINSEGPIIYPNLHYFPTLCVCK